MSWLPIFAAVAFLVLHWLTLRRRSGLPLPPGPKGLPLVGNFYDIAEIQESLWMVYLKWSRIYGDILHHVVFGHHTVVLNSHKAVTELLDKRSYNYSDRPDLPMFIDLMGVGWMFGVMRHSDWWRLHRRTFHQYFQLRAMPQYHGIQRAAARSLMQSLAVSPEDFVEHVQYQAGSIVLKLVYGYTLQTRDDPYLRLLHNTLEGNLKAAVHGTFWVDYLPVLKYLPAWFPGAGFKRKAKVWKQFNADLKEEPFKWVEKDVKYGTVNPSFVTQSAERLSVTLGEDSTIEDVIKNCAAVAYFAGADTIVSSILSFILAMTLHPEIQIRAQKEIESVIGSERLPDFDDREKLSFVNALIAETLRWNPVTPLALLHRALRDDIYEGYFIPAGATIIPNTWAILHDENLYGPNPMDFNPDRFLGNEAKARPNPELFAFGHGRRICPGRYLALNSLYLTMSYLLSTYTIAKALDDNGDEVTPNVEYTSGVISHPKPFQCRFIPRGNPNSLGGTNGAR